LARQWPSIERQVPFTQLLRAGYLMRVHSVFSKMSSAAGMKSLSPDEWIVVRDVTLGNVGTD